jgi:probable F420-dependent oxidoreductase
MEHMARYLDSMDLTAEQGSDIGPVVPRVLASLRPNMLQLARDRSDGAHTYFVPPDHTVGARQVLGPGKLLVAEQAVVLGTDPDEARRVAREHMSWYLQLPNYANNLKQLGYADEDIAGGGSDRPVDAIVAWGDAVAVATRVREHHDAGADHVLIQALGDGNKALEQLVRLGPVVVGVGRS